MKRILTVACIGTWAMAIGMATWGRAETHANFQAVNASGVSTWSGTYPFTIQGVILNDPEEMLDFAWDPGAESGNRMGAQWQVFFQAVDSGDRGGTACWMGQNYSGLGPWIPEGNFYSESAWSNEIYRLNNDTNVLHRFRKGDLVEITVRTTAFYGGKRNVNENHRVTNANDFAVALVQAGYGLPDPEVIRLSDLMNVDDGNPSTREDIFDQTRATGGEHYQGMRVRIESVRLATNYYASTGWGKTNWGDRLCTVTDGAGRYFPLRMPLSNLGPAPTNWFSAVGVINQESGSGSDGTFGYELFVQEIGPTLGMVRDGGRLLIYWPATYTNYTLEYSTNLTVPSSWHRVETPSVKLIAVEESPTATGDPTRVYRLKQQQ